MNHNRPERPFSLRLLLLQVLLYLLLLRRLEVTCTYLSLLQIEGILIELEMHF